MPISWAQESLGSGSDARHKRCSLGNVQDAQVLRAQRLPWMAGGRANAETCIPVMINRTCARSGENTTVIVLCRLAVAVTKLNSFLFMVSCWFLNTHLPGFLDNDTFDIVNDNFFFRFNRQRFRFPVYIFIQEYIH